MARVDYPDPAALTPEVRDKLTRLGSLNVTRMMSHHEGLMGAFARLGSEFLLRGTLPPVIRELVILRIGQLCQSDYEWHQHVSVARAVGMSEELLGALRNQTFDALPERERSALRFAEDIFEFRAARAETFAAAQKQFSIKELVELSLLAGYYIMTAGYLKSFDIEIETTPPLGASMPRASHPPNSP